MARSKFFDSPPTTESRLLTFKCPYHKEGDSLRKHLITIAWKAEDPAYGESISLLAENEPYVGKPLAVMPNAIKGYPEEYFPKGSFLLRVRACQEKMEKYVMLQQK